MYSVILAWRLSSLSKSQIVLQRLFPQLIFALKDNTIPEYSYWWDQIEYCDVSSKFYEKWSRKSQTSRSKLDKVLKDVFSDWYQLEFPEKPDLRYEERMLNEIYWRFRIISYQDSVAAELPQGVCLFLAVMSETQARLGARDGRLQFAAMREAYNHFGNFMNWLEGFVRECAPLSGSRFCTRVACRYFVFEFLRQCPKASLKLCKANGWNSDSPLQEIWKICREKINESKPIFDKYLAALWNRGRLEFS
eukprot:Gregarina_sp_Poly_1__2139@NODE_1568_length_3829_cov_59_695641_g1035_i0_p2_GENE_NODE_1568_length_3829_cov_59_695641_g1035_i0NODE_1568_length_3829_cov_59_695641_g1035_i0_p2_ORF_typecomplete_len249_score34_21Glyco_hydro_42/PF02449_15/0_22_NODE_1568_length_3829_cov_59_695641_g1035_i020122758